MKITSAVFVKSATKPEELPKLQFPEVAFLGRSNVGKSSLINSLLGVSGLARTSSTPGRTQLINYFLINGGFYFVDLPGYGYARVPVEVKRTWGPMITGYVASRSSIVLLILIVDLRHEPTKLDIQAKEWLESATRPFVIVATKADKLSNNEQRVNAARASAALGGAPVIPYSAVTRRGLGAIWKAIERRLPAIAPGR